MRCWGLKGETLQLINSIIKILERVVEHEEDPRSRTTTDVNLN